MIDIYGNINCRTELNIESFTTAVGQSISAGQPLFVTPY